MKIPISIIFFLGIFLNDANAQNHVRIMDSVFNWQADNHLLMGNLLVAEKGKIVFKKSYGYQNVEQAIPNTDSSAFAIASITKVFTSTAILQLKEKGLLKLDEQFSHYFPDFPYPDITIRHLLTHTSGLPEYELFDSLVKTTPNKIFTNADIIPALKVWSKQLYFKPGTGWRYSGMNFCLLVLLIERLSELTLQQYFETYIFQPAGMRQCYIDNLIITQPNKYRTRNYENKPFSTDLINVDSVPAEHTMIYNYGGFTGQGSLTCTAADLLLFDRAFFSGQLLNAVSVREALTPAVLNDGKKAMAIAFPGYGESYYGLGWFITWNQSLGKIVYHPGGRPGVGTMYVHNVTKNQVVILLENMAASEASASSANALFILNHRQPIAQKISLARTYATALHKSGSEVAGSLLNRLKEDKLHYNMNSDDWLDRAKDFFGTGQKELAIEMLKTGVEVFSNESVISEAYGDVLSMLGKKEEAIAMYQKSLTQNPKNETARHKLDVLQARQ